MATIANTKENQYQQINKITDILAGISQFLVQGNLSQNAPNNGVPPFTCQLKPLGQNTPEQILPIDRNDKIRAGKQTRRAKILHLGFS